MTRRDYAAIATAYARDVTKGKVPACQWVRLACERQLRDLKASRAKSYPYRFDRGEAARVCGFLEQLPHVKGPKAGQPLLLEPHQVFRWSTVFGWVEKRTGLRRFRRVYIEVPRKNGKSQELAGVGLYMLGADGEQGAEIYSGATTKDQAKIVWSTAHQQVRKTPDLRSELGIEALAHAIVQLETTSKFVAVAADDGTLDGLNPHAALIDELHAHKTRGVYDVFETAMGARAQPLLLVITTAGTNRAGICYELRTYLTKVLLGTVADDRQFGVIYTIDDDDDWTDERSWIKANPNWGVSVMPEYVAQLATKAMQTPAAIPNFQTKHLNIWVNADQAWMDMRAWQRAADPTLALEDFAGQPCIIGLDLASKVDLVAAYLIFRRPIDEVFHYYGFGRFYLPSARADEGGHGQYRGWALEGRLILTEGDVVDFQQIEDDLLADATKYQVREIPYDPWQAVQMAQNLERNGATPVELRPTVGNFSAPMKELDALVRQGRFHHDGCPAMSWMVSNVVCHVDAKDNIYPRKERPENKIDGVVAAITALNRWLAHQDEGPSVYEGRGILSL